MKLLTLISPWITANARRSGAGRSRAMISIEQDQVNGFFQIILIKINSLIFVQKVTLSLIVIYRAKF